jgi:hypothetical protein
MEAGMGGWARRQCRGASHGARESQTYRGGPLPGGSGAELADLVGEQRSLEHVP